MKEELKQVEEVMMSIVMQVMTVNMGLRNLSEPPRPRSLDIYTLEVREGAVRQTGEVLTLIISPREAAAQ